MSDGEGRLGKEVLEPALCTGGAPRARMLAALVFPRQSAVKGL